MGHFHAGELGVQRQRGARRAAERVGRIVESEIPPRLGPLLGRHRMAVAASLDARRRPWASLLAGSPGFVQVVDEHLLRVVVDPTMDELLVTNLTAHADVGLLVIDPETRERWRVNGRGQLRPEGLFILVDQVYGNCPKYIHRRRVAATSNPEAGRPTRAESLDRRQRALVAEADTFFIATWHPARLRLHAHGVGTAGDPAWQGRS